MTDDLILQVSQLGKCFKLYRSPWGRALEWLTLGRKTRHRKFWAVKNVSIEVRRGEFLGIIGPNGAGKSTLLKMISGVMHPTQGSYQVQGRVLSLLELNTGLDRELSGKENIIKNADMLGFPDQYIQDRMAQIKEFSELEDFFERPVKFYSTGLRTRLAFSLFAFLECDVLILDEVLAVGDIFFRQKCYARLNELIAQNTAIILVTHNLSAIRQYCDEVIVLDRGEKIYQGDPDEAIRTFTQVKGRHVAKLIKATSSYEDDEFSQPVTQEPAQAKSELFWPTNGALVEVPPAKQQGVGRARLTGMAICNDTGEPCQTFRQGEQAYIYYEFELKQNAGVPIGSIEIRNQYNVLVHSKNSLQSEARAPNQVQQGSVLRFRHSFKLGLAPGPYTFGISLLALDPRDYSQLKEISQQELYNKWRHLCRVAQVGVFSIIPRFGERLEQLHGGLCDLPGDCYIQLITKSQPKSDSKVATAVREVSDESSN